eukprot:7674472-Ditylum_brightwellii.AAC.1
MSPFLNAILPKLGINHHFPRVVLHGTKKYGGLQMAHFFIEQGYLSIKYFLGHVQEESLTGQHFMVLLSQAQLASGSKHPYLYEEESNKEYVSHSWLSGIWQYLQYINATIEVHHAWVTKLQREDDVMLMDAFKTAKLEIATLDHLNQLRLYLGVTTLADI